MKWVLKMKGYIYCLSISTKPDLFRLGYVIYKPDLIRILQESNQEPGGLVYTIEMVRETEDVPDKMHILDAILRPHNPLLKPYFYQSNLQYIHNLLNLMSGPWITFKDIQDNQDTTTVDDNMTLNTFADEPPQYQHNGHYMVRQIGINYYKTNKSKFCLRIVDEQPVMCIGKYNGNQIVVPTKEELNELSQNNITYSYHENFIKQALSSMDTNRLFILTVLPDGVAIINSHNVSAYRGRDMAMVLKDNQLIRHVYGESIWIARYRQEFDDLYREGQSYYSPGGFVKAHYGSLHINKKSADGWTSCQAFHNENWVSMKRMIG